MKHLYEPTKYETEEQAKEPVQVKMRREFRDIFKVIASLEKRSLQEVIDEMCEKWLSKNLYNTKELK